MTTALGLLAGALLVAVAAPRYLRLALRSGLRAGVALAAWIASVGAVVGASLGSAVLLLIPRNGSADTPLGMARSCVNAASWDSEPVGEYVVRLATALAIIAVVARVGVVALRRSLRHARWRRGHLSLLRVLGTRERSVWWLDGRDPVAYSVGGRSGTVVASTAVHQLDPATRSAVLAHERAHLQGRHHWLVLMTGAFASAAPFVPLFRAAPPAVGVLVELAADEAAARECGAPAVRAALQRLARKGENTGAVVPPSALAMSRDAVELRLRWLARPEGPRSQWRLSSGVGRCTAVLASVAPLAVAIAGVSGTVLLFCRWLAG